MFAHMGDYHLLYVLVEEHVHRKTRVRISGAFGDVLLKYAFFPSVAECIVFLDLDSVVEQ
jgi:hypothetical protein